ncbi:DddA-like double-stranded DNA deaminase toxin [Streptomyces sp. NPDC005963]|uniref:DddA-like double-stranded DNA deaminase toxin n=1 Tax=Streptomyces sp. NPDC005963 TaxID=3156721 RepID=UPI0033E6410A
MYGDQIDLVVAVEVAGCCLLDGDAHPGDEDFGALGDASGTTRTESVTRLIVTDSDKRFTTLTLRTPDKRTTKLKATSHHPYWETKTRRWAEAEDLASGDRLRSTNGANSTVRALTSTREAHRTFDLTVSNVHTYYVLAGATPVLVHNCSPLDGIADGLAGSKITTGQVVDDAGNKVGAPVSSGENGSFVQVRGALRKSGVPHDAAGGFAAASHVETKIALAMRSNGVQRATVVINNSDGVCSGPYMHDWGVCNSAKRV